MKTNIDICIDDELFDSVEIDVSYVYDSDDECFIVSSALINTDKTPFIEDGNLSYYRDCDIWDIITEEQKLTIFEEIEFDFWRGILSVMGMPK